MNKKIISMALAICMVFGSAAALPQGTFVDTTTGITASADWQQYGDFKYDYLQDGTVEIKGYTGKSRTVRIPSKIGKKIVSSIGDYAFNENKNIDTIVVPDNVKHIKDSAFKACFVKKISISKTVTQISDSAFLSCPNLTEIKVAAANKTFASANGALLNKAKTELICCPGGIAKFTVPNGVKIIKKFAFWGCEKLKSINVSDSVTTLEGDAIYYCPALKTLNLGRNVTNLGSTVPENPAAYVANDCENLTNINVNKANKVFASVGGVVYDKSKKTLLNCPKNKSKVTISARATKIAYGAFSGNHALTSVYIPNNVKELSSYCFSSCSALKTVIFTNGIKNIPVEAFRECTSLTSVSIPKGVVTIDSEAFFSCSSLKSVNIPDSVKQIWGNAFKYTDLTDVYIPASVTEMDTTGEVFDSKVVIYGQKGTKAQEYAKKYGYTFKVISQPLTRFAGADRGDTAAKISNATNDGSYKTSDTVVLATGFDFHDALAAVPLASAYNAPLLLSDRDSLSETTLGEIKRLKAKNIIVVATTTAKDQNGYNAAIGSNVYNQLKKYNVIKLSGSTYYETAKKVAVKLQKITKKAPDSVFITTDKNYADALSASPVAAIKNAPILYVDPTAALDTTTKNYLASIKKSVKSVYIVGGVNAVSKNVEKSILSVLVKKKASRFSGNDRYETCIKINKAFANRLTGKTVCIAKGYNFPDALAGGVFAANQKAPLFLADKLGKTTLSKVQKDYLKSKKAGRFYIFGGDSAVPTDLVLEVSRASK